MSTSASVYFDERLVYFEENGDVLYDVENDIAIGGWELRLKKHNPDQVKTFTKADFLEACRTGKIHPFKSPKLALTKKDLPHG